MKSAHWLPALVLLTACGAPAGPSGNQPSGAQPPGSEDPQSDGLVVRIAVLGVT